MEEGGGTTGQDGAAIDAIAISLNMHHDVLGFCELDGGINDWMESLSHWCSPLAEQ